MPVKPENKSRYPANWPQIRAAILARAENRCEWCGVPNYAWVVRDGRTWENLGHAETLEGARALRVGLLERQVYAKAPVRIVLTIAHLDHTPENCDAANLRAACQRCHLTYDAAFHARNAAATRRQRRAVGQGRLL